MTESGLNRRRLLISAGAGVLGISVLNTVSACRSSGGRDTTAATQTDAPSPSASPGGSSGEAGLGDWKRVNLSFVSAYLLVRGDEVAVVDFGVEGSAAAIEDGLTAAGAGWDKVKHVILTHNHPDHAGGLAEAAEHLSAAIYAGEADVAGVNAEISLRPVKDGDEVFGLQIVGTPGHTAGHISVFDPSVGVLATGDALRNMGGLVGPAPEYTADMPQAIESVKKLATLEIKAILPGHGDPVTTNAAEELQRLAASL